VQGDTMKGVVYEIASNSPFGDKNEKGGGDAVTSPTSPTSPW